MNDSISKRRAEMPSGTSAVLSRRTLERSNRNLFRVLKPGDKVLDVGCGNGAITQGICEYVGDNGVVIGVDPNDDLIRQAQESYSGIKSLCFYCADILSFDSLYSYDVVTCARTLQWVANPHIMVQKMKNLLKPGGVICVLDYDHTAIEWQPNPPASMLFFYDAFLKWRADAGMDNRIAIHVGNIMRELELEIIREDDESEYYERSASEFVQHIDIWSVVAETRGKQMVNDAYITEQERLQALSEYRNWCLTTAQGMKLVLRAVHGVNK